MLSRFRKDSKVVCKGAGDDVNKKRFHDSEISCKMWKKDRKLSLVFLEICDLAHLQRIPRYREAYVNTESTDTSVARIAITGYLGKLSSGMGLCVCFSLFPNKNLFFSFGMVVLVVFPSTVLLHDRSMSTSIIKYITVHNPHSMFYEDFALTNPFSHLLESRPSYS